MNKKLLSVAAAGTLFLGGCANNGDSNASEETNDQLTVYASTFALKSIAEEIGGNRVQVEMVIPPGADPHTYEPTSRQMTQIAEADLFLTVGHDLEPYVESMEKSLANEDVSFVKTAENVTLLDADKTVHVHGEDEHAHEEDEHAHEEDAHGHSHGQYDPHVWLDPMNAVSMAEAVEAAFADQAPDYKDEFADRLSAFKEEAEALDAELQAAVDGGSKKQLLVTHAAYGYMADRYGFEQLPIAGLTPSEEPSQQALKRVIEEARAHDLTHIAFEDTVTPKVAEVVKNEIGAETVTIYNLESVTKEQMEQSYFDLMRENVKALEIALK
ncbi:metal ABC transporter solute-binding protein, Zn/Mn family [Exiguobacterium aurantiacum]|uniref:Probable zinc transport system zinc-binding lipoprotein AdcA n=1 Tax=Exiguobacterium aurantiacum TaxID=33987 RepID=A0A377FWX8_9BACL|nr:zinc ABC transporter substrate-binding protein [Exiguobacterium aurantiacum]STO09330.1 Probable zinc transport system zinc-binding lipoprotein AdcA precursor [Exiguobacterium aurantiacum]